MKEQKGVLFGLGRFKMSRWVVEGAIKTFGNQGLDSLLHGVGKRAGKLAIVEFKFGKAGGRNLAKVKEICSFYGIARRLGDAGRMDLYLELLAGNVESYACFEQGNVLMRINLDVLQHDSDWGKPGAYTILPGGFEP